MLFLNCSLVMVRSSVVLTFLNRYCLWSVFGCVNPFAYFLRALSEYRFLCSSVLGENFKPLFVRFFDMSLRRRSLSLLAFSGPYISSYVFPRVGQSNDFLALASADHFLPLAGLGLPNLKADCVKL